MAHVEVSDVSYDLPDGRPLLAEVTLRVGEGQRTALIGSNGTGKTTLLRLVTGELTPTAGTVVRSGGLQVMAQSAGAGATDVRDLLLSVAPAPLRAAAAELDASELAMVEDDDEPSQMRYATAIAGWGDAGGYEAEVTWDVVCDAALGTPFERARWRQVSALSGGERKRLLLESLLTGRADSAVDRGALLLDEPDNSLDVPGKRWLEEALVASGRTVLLVSHDRELLARTATRIATLEPGPAGARLWVHGGGFESYADARADRTARLEELRRRWEEDHAALRQLVLRLKQKATFNDGMSSRYQAAQTRLARFQDAGPPTAAPTSQELGMRLRGGRTAKRAVTLTRLGLTGLVAPFDLELQLGDRLAVLGSNGSGKSHLLRLLAAGGTHPEAEHEPVGEGPPPEPVGHTGTARLGSRVRPGWFRQSSALDTTATATATATAGRRDERTLLDVLHRGDGHRSGLPREPATRALDRYGLAHAAEQRFETLSGGQRARFGVLLLELSGATLLLLDEPTDNLDLESAEALEAALERFEGTVVAVTHDRWFARGFSRFLVLGADGTARESDEPVWDEPRVQRAR